MKQVRVLSPLGEVGGGDGDVGAPAPGPHVDQAGGWLF